MNSFNFLQSIPQPCRGVWIRFLVDRLQQVLKFACQRGETLPDLQEGRVKGFEGLGLNQGFPGQPHEPVHMLRHDPDEAAFPFFRLKLFDLLRRRRGVGRLNSMIPHRLPK